ncbi:NYN domain-containing protein [Pseudomonadota bacterium]
MQKRLLKAHWVVRLPSHLLPPDGFNLYHSICSFNNPNVINKKIKAKDLKWCNLRKVCEFYASKIKNGSIVDIYFFTAFPSHRDIKQQKRHQQYCNLLEKHCDIKIINGKFKQKALIECRKCDDYWYSHEEKQTDTNFALKIITDIYENKIDTVFMITNDSDAVPVIETIKRYKPHISLSLIVPPSTKKTKIVGGDVKIHGTTILSHDLKIAMNNYYNGKGFNRIYLLKANLMLKNSFDDEIVVGSYLYKNPYKKHNKRCKCWYCS